MEMFEREFSFRFDKEPKDLWLKGFIYQAGDANAAFIAFRKGYALGIAKVIA
jgi:hypothetical protein